MDLKIDRDEVFRLYNEGKSAAKIAEIMGCSTHPVLDILKKAGLTRNRSEARLIGIREGSVKLPKSAIKKGTISWNKGKSMSEASKLKLSQSLKQKYATDPLFREKIKHAASNFWDVEANRNAMSNRKKEYYKTHPEFHPRLGKKHPTDTRKKISETKKRSFTENPELRLEHSQRLKQLYAEKKIVPWHKAKWSDSEVSFLKGNYRLSDEELSKKLGKTTVTIARKRYELGLQKKAFTRWNDEQVILLRERYPNTSNNELAKFLNKTKWAISLKAYELELKKSDEYLASPEYRIHAQRCLSRAARLGSKPEKRAYTYFSLVFGKEQVKFKDWSILGRREVDISMHSLKIAIEYDGPLHFFAIHGKEKLEKRKQRDKQKKEDLEKLGWRFFRIYDEDGISYHEMEEQCNAIIRSLPGFEDFIPPQKRLTE